MKLYKLTDPDGMSGIGYSPLKWSVGVTHNASGTGELCTDGWIHAYTDPLLAILLNPIHANIENPRLWKVEGEIGKTDYGLKVGSAELKCLGEIPVPKITLTQSVAFGILCAKKVYDDENFVLWADRWLSGEYRTEEADWAAAARAASWAAAAARAAVNNLDLIELAHEAMGY